MILSDKQKKILALLGDGEFHSGTELAHSLGISRSAVWKQLNSFTQLGLSIAAVTGKGYRLEYPFEPLVTSKILEVIDTRTNALISSFEIHDQIDSTNRYLVTRAQQNALSGSVCLAEYQTQGKGRRGRQWISPYGCNIYLSILWRFQQGPAAIIGLSLAIGVAVIRALKQYQIANIGLKWPNDIYSQQKKLGGILVEISGESDGPCSAVIGLGLNLFLPENQAHGINQAWTDLTKITGHSRLYRNKLTGILLNHMLPVLDEYETLGLNNYLEEWRKYDCLSGKWATLFIGQQQFEGIVRGINNDGMLLIERTDGSVQTFASGEVSFRNCDEFTD